MTVRGELSGWSRAASGHCYFTLKDADGAAAMLRCAMFRRAAALLDFAPGDGQQVELRGRIAVYEARGELQCVVEAMQPLGAGSLYELFLRLRAQLQAAGLFDASRKRTIRAFPQALGVVTSASGAALHDVLTTLARRSPQVKVVVYPTLVQGAAAPAQIAEALATAGRRLEVDTIILCRGGGSLEDLWAFNDERVVRAIAACPLPVVCGVGHETDLTLADLAADLRAPTPTAAAELAAPLRDDALQHLSQLQAVLARAVQRRLDRDGQRLDRLALQMGRPARRLALQAQRLAHLGRRRELAWVQVLRLREAALADLGHRLHQGGALALARQHEGLAVLAQRLAAVDPQRVLQRGYAWVSDDTGRPVTQAASLAVGQRIQAVWADGQAQAQVTAVQPVPEAPTGTEPSALPTIVAKLVFCRRGQSAPPNSPSWRTAATP